MRSSLALVLILMAAGPVEGARVTHARHSRVVRMTGTAYCLRGRTADGDHTRRGIIAADPRVLPMGTRVWIDTSGRRARTYEVTDKGRSVKGRKIDIFMPSCHDAKRFGRRCISCGPSVPESSRERTTTSYGSRPAIR